MWLKSLRNSGHHPENKYICWELPTYQCCTIAHCKSHWNRSRGLRCIDDLGTCNRSSIAHIDPISGGLVNWKKCNWIWGHYEIILSSWEVLNVIVHFFLSNLRGKNTKDIYLNVPRCGRNPSSRTSPPQALLQRWAPPACNCPCPSSCTWMHWSIAWTMGIGTKMGSGTSSTNSGRTHGELHWTLPKQWPP